MTNLRVLLIEDDVMIGMLLSEMLEEMGHDVCAIERTETDAVAAAQRHLPDLMIIDARLAHGDGISMVEKVLCTGFVPHLFISGDISFILKRRPKAVVLQKPFLERELARAIQHAVNVPRPS